MVRTFVLWPVGDNVFWSARPKDRAIAWFLYLSYCIGVSNTNIVVLYKVYIYSSGFYIGVKIF